jgi:protocatechuate 3,4-dioxygenase beta subunit
MAYDGFLSRRRVIVTGACAGLVLPVRRGLAQGPAQDPAPMCHDGDAPTLPEIEGPYFKPRSPLRGDLREPGITGRKVELTGLVLTHLCRPVADAVVDLWHADERGEYDNGGFRLRGHVLTDAQGHYAFLTIMPGLYPGRTRHYHIKVRAPNRPVLTTQLYFPDEPRNRRDGLFDADLLMQVAAGDDTLRARFDVVLA